MRIEDKRSLFMLNQIFCRIQRPGTFSGTKKRKSMAFPEAIASAVACYPIALLLMTNKPASLSLQRVEKI